jgi:hypothetical protein
MLRTAAVVSQLVEQLVTRSGLYILRSVALEERCRDYRNRSRCDVVYVFELRLEVIVVERRVICGLLRVSC